MLPQSQGLPWNNERGEAKRLKTIVSCVTPVFLLILVYVTWVDLPEQDRAELEALPPQLAKVMLKKKEPPKPVVPEKEEIKPEPEKPKEEKIVEKPKPKEQPKVVKEKPKKKPKPEEVAKAREKAKKSGLLAMSSQFSKLSALADSVKLDTPKTITAKPIASKHSDMLASHVKTSSTRSSGIDEAQFNDSTQELQLAGYQAETVQATEEVADVIEYEETSEALLAQRTSEDVRKTMDANKSAIYSIYNRALRKKPSLQGLVTPELVIEENGVVSSCSVVESTLNEPKLERKICNRLRLVNFGSKPGVEQLKIRYPIELLPG